MSLAVSELIAFYLLLPTFVWGALVTLARPRTVGAADLNDALERTRLALMIAPALFGLVIAIGVRAMPGALPDLPALDVLDGLDAARGAEMGWSAPLEATSAPWLDLLMFSVVAVYLAGLVVLLGRLALQLAAIARIVRAAEGSHWGGDVVRTATSISPFAALGGRVVLPVSMERSLEPRHLRLIIAHEREHVRRGDPATFALLSAIGALFWINPFIREQTNRCRIAAELACDAAVTGAAPSMREAYAHALVLALKHTAGNARPCAPAVFSTRNLGEHRMRIERIMSDPPQQSKRTGWLAIVSMALLALPATWFHVAWAENEGDGALSVIPTEGEISSGFGPAIHPVTKEHASHSGIDIRAAEWSPVLAAGPGRVTQAGFRSEGYGNTVEILHDGGVQTRYASLSAWEVEAGDQVEAGQVIGRVGASGKYATGPHLHWEVWRDGEAIDPASIMDIPSPD